MRAVLAAFLLAMLAPAAAAQLPSPPTFLPVCASVDGPADCSFVAVSVRGESRSNLTAVSLAGDATCKPGATALCAALSGAGAARGNLAAVSLAGDAVCTFQLCPAVSPAGASRGGIAVGALGTCNGVACIAVAPEGDATGYWLAVSIDGDSTALVAVSVGGDARSRSLPP